MSSLGLLLVCCACLLVNADFDLSGSKQANAIDLTDYTHIYIPSGSNLNVVGGIMTPQQLVTVTFLRNAGRPFLFSGENHFVPLTCHYQYQFFNTFTFAGCYNNLTLAWPRVDSPDASFPVGSEVFFVSKVVVEIRATASDIDLSVYNPLSSISTCTPLQPPSFLFLQPSVQVSFTSQSLTYAQKIASAYDGQTFDAAHIPSYYPPQSKALLTYLKSFVTRDYPSFLPYLAPSVQFEVVGLANYSGANVVYNYQLLADFDTSDNIRINGIGLMRLVTQGHLAMFEVMMLSDEPHLGSSPLEIWNNKYSGVVEFDRYGRMASFVQHVNLLDAYIRKAPQTNGNLTYICGLIQAKCTADVQIAQLPNTNAVQYASFDACIAYLQSIPALAPAALGGIPTSGQNVQCVQWHAALAQADPVDHCLHVGTQKISATTTPCQNF